MVSPVILAKEHPELPDYYGVRIMYINGKTEEFKLAAHSIDKELGMLTFWTYHEDGVQGDLHSWIPLSSIQRLEFDKNFSKGYAIKCERDRKRQEAFNGVRD